MHDHIHAAGLKKIRVPLRDHTFHLRFVPASSFAKARGVVGREGAELGVQIAGERGVAVGQARIRCFVVGEGQVLHPLVQDLGAEFALGDGGVGAVDVRR
jgi:hypothetical protein